MSIIIAAIFFILFDLIWLGLIANEYYIRTLGSLLRMDASGGLDPFWPAAVVVYIALVGGIVAFVLPKAKGNPWLALLWGAVFGFVTYATYDFTNLAVLDHWPIRVAIVDTLWGMVLCGLTSLVTCWLPKLWQ